LPEGVPLGPNPEVLAIINRILDQQGQIVNAYTTLLELLSHPIFVVKEVE
jgi:hypothetical protein